MENAVWRGLSFSVLLTLAGMRIWPRFFFLDIGFLLILIVLGVQRAAGWIGGRRAGALFALVVAGMLVISAGMAARNYRFPKQNLEGAIAVAQQAARPGERTHLPCCLSGAGSSRRCRPRAT